MPWPDSWLGGVFVAQGVFDDDEALGDFLGLGVDIDGIIMRELWRSEEAAERAMAARRASAADSACQGHATLRD